MPLGNARWDFTWHSEYSLVMQGKKRLTEAETGTKHYKGVQKTEEQVSSRPHLPWQNEGGDTIAMLKHCG